MTYAALAVIGTLFTVAAGGDPACVTSASPASLAKRASPLDSTSFTVGSAQVKICYGRPSSRGRTMIGGHHVPYGSLWRTGANEPTTLHTTGALLLGGIRLEPGSYSIYTIPGESEWQIIVNRSTDQWGDEGSYAEVKKHEVGRTTAKPYRLERHLEQFTIRAEPSRSGAMVYLEWEYTRVALPVEPSR
jgi:hypothetical protein